MAYYKITFYLDGTGIYYDPAEPPHLDALIHWVLAPKQGVRHLDRDMEPTHVGLPLKQLTLCGSSIYRASALFPEGYTAETIWYWRKRLRQGRVELTTGSPNLVQGQYRDWQMPVPLLLCTRLVAYANGGRKDLRNALSELRYIGKKRAHGHGKIIRIDVDSTADGQDHSIASDGRAMRWLPTTDGAREVRPTPPYWHPIGRVPCCEIGAPTERC